MRRTPLFIFLTLAYSSFAFNRMDAQHSISPPLENALPAIVFIANETDHFALSHTQNPDSYYHWFPSIYEYFRPYYLWKWPVELSHGSGFIFHPEGYVITNAHVVAEASSTLIAMHSPDLRIARAFTIYIDDTVDIAILKLENPDGRTFPYLSFGDSNQLKLGDPISIIGSPRNPMLESTVTTGIISGKDRNGFGQDKVEGYLQTDAALNGGNSGGPMLNHRGEVVGVVSWGYSHFWGTEGLGFAIPSNIVKRVADQIVLKGSISQGFLGVGLEEITEIAFDVFEFDSVAGAMVAYVLPLSPAEVAGLKEGDYIFEINHAQVRSHSSLRNEMYSQKPGDEITLKVRRGEEEFTKTIVLEMADPSLRIFYETGLFL